MNDYQVNISFPKNGCKLVTVSVENLKTIKTKIFYNIGSIYENETTHGMSHFIEHMMFNTSENYTGEERTYIFDTYGDGANAYTQFDKTCYSIRGLTKYYDKIFHAFEDMMLRPKFEEKDIEKEKNIITQEIKQRLNDASTRNYFNLYKTSYTGSGLALGDICGTVESISQFDHNSLMDFYNTYYVFPNMTIFFIGDITPEKSFSLIKDWKREGRKNNKINLENFYNKTSTAFIEEQSDQVSSPCLIGFRVAWKPQNYFDLILRQSFVEYFSRGLSSPLYRILRERNNLVYGCWSSFSTIEDEITFLIGWETSQENIDKCYELATKEFEKMRNGEFEEESLNRVLISLELAWYDIDSTYKKIGSLVETPVYYGFEPCSYNDVLNFIESLDTKTLKNHYEKILNNMNDRHFSCVVNSLDKIPQVISNNFNVKTAKFLSDK